jgi:tRNA (guanosine-2'-O-)-methyltransferase
MKEELIKYLESFITPRRLKLFNSNLLNRTRYITVLLEDVYQLHNASAILRTCDCLGIQDAHIIENHNQYQLNSEISLGAEQWLSIYKYNHPGNNTQKAISNLKKKGYRIVATSSHAKNTNLESFDLTKGKIAFVFGTELSGITVNVEEMADEFIKIPMVGFSESFNISVSAGIILQQVSSKLRQSSIDWQISDEELIDIKLDWLKKTIKKPEQIEKYFIENIFKKKPD